MVNGRKLMVLAEADFDIRIRPSPNPRYPRHPILSVDCLSALGVFFRRKNARGGRELRTGHLASNRARSDCHFWIVANTFRLPHIAARHHVQLATILTEPDRCRDAQAVFAKRLQRNIFLIRNGMGNLARHEMIVVAIEEMRRF
jgi:hypothetical protein